MDDIHLEYEDDEGIDIMPVENVEMEIEPRFN